MTKHGNDMFASCFRFVLAMAAIAGTVCSTSPASGEQASVSFGSVVRPLTHAGVGVLHSMDATTPNDSLIDPLDIRNYRQHPNSPVYDRALAKGFDSYQVVVSDKYYAPFNDGSRPGDNGDWTEWEQHCRDVATQALQQNLNVQFDMWNEPDQPVFWGRSEEQFMEMWKRGVNSIRSVDPGATIIGPSTSVQWWFTNLNVEKVLTYAKANNVLPDIISWHSWGRQLPAEIDTIRSLCAANGIDTSRISINEYLWWFDEYRPGPIVYFLNQIEQKNVESGIKSCWGTLADNSLDGLVTPAGQPRSTWWVYERYSRMSGSSVVTVSGGETLDIVASQDEGVAYALVGRYKDSYVEFRDQRIVNNWPDEITPASVLLQNLDDVPSLIYGDKIHVLAELIKNSEQEASSGPVVMIDADFTTINGELNLSLPSFGTFDAYFLTLTAVAGMPGDFNRDGVVDAADYVLARIGPDSAVAIEVAKPFWSNVGAWCWRCRSRQLHFYLR